MSLLFPLKLTESFGFVARCQGFGVKTPKIEMAGLRLRIHRFLLKVQYLDIIMVIVLCVVLSVMCTL